MKQESSNNLSELCSLLIEIEKLCKDYSHIAHIEAVKRIKQIAESNYQLADNILNERQRETD
jgi:hypothetical protein